MLTIIALNLLKALVPLVIISFLSKSTAKFIFISLLFLLAFSLFADKIILSEEKTIITLILGASTTFFYTAPLVFLLAAFRKSEPDDKADNTEQNDKPKPPLLQNE